MLLAAGALSLLPRPAHALSPELQATVRAWSGGTLPREARVLLDIAPLVENGNAVPIRITVESPMTAASFVQEIVVFNERNPQRDVARFTLSPANGRADVSTRIRLATSQQLIALARLNDGSLWSHSVDVVVTLAACIEG
ncbi:SoxY-related AACIE arm protein [Aquabacterium sp.]|uniref:SoxY-related AACIE arm protein n=1 Tax=Aquabacterium sp. TaxID=1872578 RepID=UPI002C487B30|nr:SoxY-related AACIE arm protein [Aquabacterium sp.]HSW03000.1 SoxY-related AACIE arm protein [Aquabacterium sp.]